MTAKKLLLFCILCLCQTLCAQHDTIVTLKEVLISDSQLKNFTDTKSVQVLNDSVIEKNQASLTSLLNYNSGIYFKENGLGMVSSPSFRGTTAQQTAVIWNGIPINSQFNGQTDFNTISSADFNTITVQSGGNSSIYGSSAIGGSIHLNTDLSFKKAFRNELRFHYGSFNTLGMNYKIRVSDAKFSSQISLSRNSSDNDYPYLGVVNQKNENGQFYNTSLNVTLGYKLDARNFLKVYSQFFESERHFSGTLSSVSKSKYHDLNSRNLLEWDGFYSAFTSKLKIAVLNEKYTYFENATSPLFESARAETFLVKYDLNYKIDSQTDLNAIIDFTKTKGIGSQINGNSRNIGSGALLFKKRFWEALILEVSLRKELTSNYKSPFLYASGLKYLVSQQYQLRLNVSRNFRIPTFNDLYWQGSGNPNLKPESATQIEFGQEFRIKNFTLSATGYHSKIKDLLRWIPANGNWSPENVGKVTSYGTEVFMSWKQTSGSHCFALNSSYSYTISKDAALDKQLIYVPYHKFNTNLAYSFKNFTTNYQFLYNGSVFTSSDNYYFLKKYQVSNLALDYTLGKPKLATLGFEVLNLWNQEYQSVAQRPLPGRNYALNLTFKF